MEDFDEESASSNMKPLIQRIKHKTHPTLARQNVMDQMESLDFQLPDNKPTRSFYKNPKIKLKSALKVIAKWLIHWSLGFLLGVVVFIIRKSVNWLNDTKFSATSYFISRNDLVSGFFIYLGINFIYVFASWFVVYMCGPLAGGSGIPEVKGYLNGIRIKGTINIKTFIGKIVSIIFSFSSCLALGPEGPMVHIGSVIGAGLAMTKSRTFGFRLPKVFKILRNDYDQRDFIVSGAAAGISAAFGAPIGGVLFVLEEAATFWSREITWRSFFACMVSAFTINLLVNGSSHGMVSDYGLVTFGASRIASYRFYELLPFTLLGICGGLLGAAFVKLNVSLMKWRRDFLKDRVFPRFAELMLVLIITSVLSFWLPLIGSCRPITDIHSTEADGKCDVQTVVTSSIYCPDGYFSDVANLFMSPQEDALKLMFARSTGIFHTWALALYATVYFFLVTVTAGLPIAGGLFVPMMLIGATYGRIAGETMAFIFPSLHPPIDESIYALIGAGAMMTGFSRITISLCVIMIEITQNVQYLLPIMIAVMFAKWTGDALSHSIYEDLMELKSIPFLEHHPPRRTYCESITAYMKHNPVCINRIERVSTVVQILNSCSHNGFPVVSNDGNDREMTYRGFILRKQLLVLLERQLYHTKLEKTPGTLDFEYISDLMSHSEFPVNKLGLPEDMQENLLLDVQPYMDTSHVIIQSTYSFLKAYDLFRLNGLRHVPVVDEKMQVVGILTRHDLLLWHFEDHEEEEEEKNSK